MTETKINAPLFVTLSNKPGAKKYIINLNQYRNWHYIANNNVKKKYKEAVYGQLYGKMFATPIEIEFTLYKGSKRKIDRANVLSIHEKFFCDAMVDLGCIEDDNDDYIYSTKYITGGLDKKNPRVEILIKENI